MMCANMSASFLPPTYMNNGRPSEKNEYILIAGAKPRDYLIWNPRGSLKFVIILGNPFVF